MSKFVVVCFILLISVFQINAQRKNVYGTVFAFKDLALKNIQVSSAKSKTTTQTDSLGNFRIVCEMEDKLELTGFGFQKKVIKLEKPQNNVKVKLIFKGINSSVNIFSLCIYLYNSNKQCEAYNYEFTHVNWFFFEQI